MSKPRSDPAIVVIGDIASGAKDPIVFTFLFIGILISSVIVPWVFVVGVGILTSLIVMLLGYTAFALLFFPKTTSQLLRNRL